MLLDKFLSNFVQTTDYPTLDAMYFIMDKLGNPHNRLKFIHVAGTNGKGSITEMLNKILFYSNYTVGKFISPHLFESNESISINDVNISDNEFENYLEKFTQISQEYFENTGRTVTRFEILTSLSILYFYEHNCDIVVLEVGLGGMYDCTNIVNSLISVFGSIEFDHTAILGNTLEEIAFQKAGIIKENSNTVIFEQPAVTTIKKVCNEKNSKLEIIRNNALSDYSYDKKYQYFKFENFDVSLNLKGKKQIENASIAIKCCQVLENYGFNIPENKMLDALKNIVHPARFETIQEAPLIIFDGAHNKNALENFAQTVQNLYPSENKTFLISFITTKDYKSNLELLLNNFENCKFIFTSGTDENNFFNNQILYDYANSLNTNNTLECDSFDNGLKKLTNEVNFIVGSFYVYEKIKNTL